MSDVPFYRTQMGHRFYETTVPSLVHEFSRLNDNLEHLLKELERRAQAEERSPKPAVNPEEPR